MLSPRLQLKVAQKQILTPGLVQMVTVLQLNRLELKDMITSEIAENPVLEELGDNGEELTPEEVQAFLEAERVGDPADGAILETVNGAAAPDAADVEVPDFNPEIFSGEGTAPVVTEEPAAPEVKPDAKDPFDEIDFGSFFDDYLDPGYKSPSSESVDKPSFETFLSSPVTLADHLQSQLAVLIIRRHRHIKTVQSIFISRSDSRKRFVILIPAFPPQSKRNAGLAEEVPFVARVNKHFRPERSAAGCNHLDDLSRFACDAAMFFERLAVKDIYPSLSRHLFEDILGNVRLKTPGNGLAIVAPDALEKLARNSSDGFFSSDV